MTDGTLSVRRRQPKPSVAALEDPFGGASLRSGAYESFLGVGQGATKGKGKSKADGDLNEFRVESKRMNRLKEYDRLLKSFKYSAALDSVLKKVRQSYSPKPHVLITILASASDNQILSYTGAYSSRRTSNSTCWSRRRAPGTYLTFVTQVHRRPTVRRNCLRHG
jgi:hypothetical protein